MNHINVPTNGNKKERIVKNPKAELMAAYNKNRFLKVNKNYVED